MCSVSTQPTVMSQRGAQRPESRTENINCLLADAQLAATVVQRTAAAALGPMSTYVRPAAAAVAMATDLTVRQVAGRVTTQHLTCSSASRMTIRASVDKDNQ